MLDSRSPSVFPNDNIPNIPVPPAMPTTSTLPVDGVFPSGWVHSSDARDPARMQTQCLLLAAPGARIDITVRFLQLVDQSRVRTSPTQSGAFHEHSAPTTVVREFTVSDLVVADVPQCIDRTIKIDAGSCERPWRDASGEEIGTDARIWKTLRGRIVASSVPLDHNVHRVSVTVDNSTPDTISGRTAAARHAMLDICVTLDVRRGEFVPPTRIPARLRRHAPACVNLHTSPRLVTPAEGHQRIVSPFEPERSRAIRLPNAEATARVDAASCATLGSGSMLLPAIVPEERAS